MVLSDGVFNSHTAIVPFTVRYELMRDFIKASSDLRSTENHVTLTVRLYLTGLSRYLEGTVVFDSTTGGIKLADAGVHPFLFVSRQHGFTD